MTEVLENSSQKISIYPNPVQDYLSFNTLGIEIEKIQIYDLGGQLLFDDLVEENKIDVSVLSSGQYIIKLFSEDKVFTSRIMKE